MNKACPFRMMREDGDDECLGEDCEWYIYGNCAITIIADKMDYIESIPSAIDDVGYAIDKLKQK